MEGDDEEALFIGGEPRPAGSPVVSPEVLGRLRAASSKEPVVLTPRMREAVANYQRLMRETAD